MPYTQVTRSPNGFECLQYILEETGHNGAEKRNEYVSGINLLSNISYHKQMQKYWDKARKNHSIQIIRIVQSFSKREFNPDNPDDIHKAHIVGQEFTTTHYPGRQVIVCTQTDGKGGCIHNHIFVNDVSMIDNKACTNEQYYHPKIRAWTDEITAQYTELDYGEKTAVKLTRTERAKREKGEYVFKDDLRSRIDKAVGMSADNEEDFLRNLTLNCIEAVKKFSPKYGIYYTYELTDISEIPPGVKRPNDNYKVRSYNLGEDYSPDSIMQKISAANRTPNENAADTTSDEIMPKTSDDYDAEPVQKNIEVLSNEKQSNVPDVDEIHIKSSHKNDTETDVKPVQNIIEAPSHEEPSYVSDVIKILGSEEDDEEEKSSKKKKADTPSQSAKKTDEPARRNPPKGIIDISKSKKGKKSASKKYPNRYDKAIKKLPHITNTKNDDYELGKND